MVANAIRIRYRIFALARSSRVTENVTREMLPAHAIRMHFVYAVRRLVAQYVQLIRCVCVHACNDVHVNIFRNYYICWAFDEAAAGKVSGNERERLFA